MSQKCCAEDSVRAAYDFRILRCGILAAVLALVVAACGATAGEPDNEANAAREAGASAPAAVERCTERLLRNADVEELAQAEQEAVRRYAETTYCSRFAERGWVYDDGTLSIEAHKWLEEGGEEECWRATEPGEPASTVPCEELDAGGPKLIRDCALLRHVPKSEVRDYLDQLRSRYGSVECEDGTPLAQLGSP
jgi:hypothetical protein